MPIKYDKLIQMLNARGVNTYTIKTQKIIGTETYKKIMQGGHIDTRSIEKLCKYLNCQPGDILEYVEDKDDGIS